MPDHSLQNTQDTLRLPIFDVAEDRATSGDSTYFEQAFINCFPRVSTNPLTGEMTVSLVKRSGSSAISTLSPTIGSYGTRDDMQCLVVTCITQLYDVYIAAFFDSNTNKIYIIQFRPKSLTTVKIGEISTCTKNDLVFLTEFTNGDMLLPAVSISYQKSDRSSGTGYYALSTSGVFTTSSLTTISSGSFPANLGTPKIITGPFQFLNGHLYIMTLDAFIYMNSLTTAGNCDVTTWNTLSTVVASQYPDKGMGVYRYKNFLLAFGQSSIEFFNDAGNPPPQASIERTDQAFIKFGCYTPKAVLGINDTIYWVSYSDSNTVGVYRMDGFVPTKISTIKEDQVISGFFAGNSQLLGQFSLECLILENRAHLIINGPTYTSGAILQSTIDTISFANDTYENNPLLFGKAPILAFSVEDKTWWGLILGDPITTSGTYAFIKTTGAFPATSQSGAYQQFCFFAQTTDTTQDQCSATCPRTFKAPNQTVGFFGTYADANPHGTVTTLPITITFQTNTYWFMNEKRKRINKIKLITDGLSRDSTDTTNIYAMYFYWIKDNELEVVGTAGRVRRIVFPNTMQRYYIPNMGMARSLMIGCTATSIDAFTVRGIEVDLTQGTS